MNPTPSRLPSRDDPSADFWRAPAPRSVPPRASRVTLQQVFASTAAPVLFAKSKLAAGAPLAVFFDPRFPKRLIVPETV